MRILIIGNLKSWKKILFEHVSQGFIDNGHSVRLLDYSTLGYLWTKIKIPGPIRNELIQRQLEKEVRAFQPDMIIMIFAHLRIDIGRLRSYYTGILTFWDYDGPNLPIYKQAELLRPFDSVLSVSRISTAWLKSQGLNAFYLPHGVNCQFYRPQASGEDDPQYKANLSYIGIPTPRRINICSHLAPYGLALYGRRWHLLPEARTDSKFSSCIRGTENILNDDVVRVYQNSSCILNTLQENLAAHHTIMSLQVFAVPACESCLITEYVDELPDAFENGKELLWYHNLEELEELVKKYTADKAAARAIGINGRRRCLAEHTQQIRMKQLLKLFE